MRLGSMLFAVGVGVLSVAKLTLGQEAYYEHQVAGGLDDYYAGRGESPGLWAGTGAGGLGLGGVVEDGALGTLLRGVDPATGTALRAPVRERRITVRTLDLESGEWREQPKRLAPVSGYDLVFSCPKSVSLVHALTGDERVRREIDDAHETACRAALGYLEREACVVRRGHGGVGRERGEGFVAAAYRHRTSRAQDPHLHTHVIVANMARSEDGEWRALDGEAILRTYRLAAGYLYEAQLRHELTRRLGVEWKEPVKGMAELTQVPEQAVRAFSSRRQSLVDHMKALGTEGFAAARVAALATREAKEQVDLPKLRQEWLERAAEHGLGQPELRRVVHDCRPAFEIDSEALASVVLGADGLTATRTTFAAPELVRAVAGSLRQGATVNQVLEATDELSQLPGVELVEPGDVPGRPARFTTHELLEVEREALRLATDGRDIDAPVADGRTLLRTLADAGLSRQQHQLVRDAALTRDRIVCTIGVAGSGKTTALRTLGEAYRQSGIPVLGAAPSGRAADELAGATGIPSSTLHRLLIDASREGSLPHRSVLVIDEAGMAETRVLAPLLRLVEHAEGKAILVGDPHQLPAVGAGGLYHALCDELGATNLTENRRQHDVTERRALARLRTGDAEPYLSYAAKHGRLNVDDEPTLAKQRLLEDWWQTASTAPAGSVMIAYHRADVQDLNEAARTLMQRAGRLGHDARILGEREFRVGDRVVCRRNDRQLGLRNGTRATVIALDAGLALHTDLGELRTVPPEYASEHVEHGYALTGHAAQGATFERAFVLLQGHGALQEWGYVACSRGRDKTRLYLAAPPTEPDSPARDPAGSDVAERIARALNVAAAEPLAISQIEPTDQTTARLLAASEHRLEQQRTRAQQRLEQAESQLDRRGWRGRGKRGAELRAEIAIQRRAIRLADEKLAERSERSPIRPGNIARDGGPGRSPSKRERADHLMDRRAAHERSLVAPLARGRGCERGIER